MKKLMCFILLLLAVTELHSTTYYVAPSGGSDSYAGTITEPWATWQKAFSTAEAGDTVYFRGGIWHPTIYAAPKLQPSQSIGHSGTAGNPICFFNYPGEVPILDCSNVAPEYGNINYGIDILQAEFIHFKGLTIRNLYGRTNPILAAAINATECCNLTFENMTVYNISGRGFFYLSGAWESWENETISPFPNETDTLRFINCDAYNLCDSVSDNPGNAADGWWCAGYKQGYFYWEGCRAWNYSDDGIDSYGSQTRYLNNCWMMGTKKYESMDLEGNGFKMAGCRYEPDVDEHKVIITNCIAAYCDGNTTEGIVGSVGFSTNLYSGANGNYQQNVLLYNNIAYKCNTGFEDLVIQEVDPIRTSIFRNNISYQSQSTGYGMTPLYEVAIFRPSLNNASHNSWTSVDYGGGDQWPGWQYNDTVSITDADFVSLDSSQLHSVRKPDGSLPDITFLHLATGSDLIGAGTNVGMSEIPDMGVDWTYLAASDTAPIVTDIPNQTITTGSSFATINLDNYVSDADNTDSQITWTYSGDTHINISIVNRVATITYDNGFTGSETITFTATDPDDLSDSDQAVFTVNSAPAASKTVRLNYAGSKTIRQGTERRININ